MSAWRWCALVAIGATTVFWPVVPGHFLGDDFGYVARFAGLAFADWPRLFIREWSDGMWGFPLPELRPVTALAFMIDARLWGLAAPGFHVTNLALHAAASTAAGALAYRLAGGRLAAALIATVLFAWHPAHVGAASWITGRSDVLSGLFGMMALAAFVRYRESATRAALPTLAVTFALAAFSKETALVVPLVAMVIDLTGRARQVSRGIWLRPYAAWTIVAALYLACRTAALGPDPRGWSVSPFTLAELPSRLVFYATHLLLPADAAFQSWWSAAAFALIAVVVVASAAIVRGDIRRAVALAAGWFLVCTVPLLVTYPSPRHLYLASGGVCIGWALVFTGRQGTRAALIAPAVLALVYFAAAMRGVESWRTAGEMSGRLHRDAIALLRQSHDADIVLLDVPGELGDVPFWSWAAPFAARPPYVDAARATVVANPDAYFHPERWHDDAALERLSRADGRVSLVQIDAQGATTITTVSTPSVRAAAGRLLSATNGAPPPIAWRNFISALARE